MSEKVRVAKKKRDREGSIDKRLEGGQRRERERNHGKVRVKLKV